MADQAGIKVSPKQAMDGADAKTRKTRFPFCLRLLSKGGFSLVKESEKEEKFAKTGSGQAYGNASIKERIAISAGVKAAKKSGLLK